MTNVIEFPRREPEGDKISLEPVTREVIIDFLSGALKYVCLADDITEAALFIKDPVTGNWMPGATSAASITELFKSFGVKVNVQETIEEEST